MKLKKQKERRTKFIFQTVGMEYRLTKLTLIYQNKNIPLMNDLATSPFALQREFLFFTESSLEKGNFYSLKSDPCITKIGVEFVA